MASLTATNIVLWAKFQLISTRLESFLWFPPSSKSTYWLFCNTFNYVVNKRFIHSLISIKPTICQLETTSFQASLFCPLYWRENVTGCHKSITLSLFHVTLFKWSLLRQFPFSPPRFEPVCKLSESHQWKSHLSSILSIIHYYFLSKEKHLMFHSWSSMKAPTFSPNKHRVVMHLEVAERHICCKQSEHME